MSRFKSTLDNVRVAAPCPADWDAMFGDERVRFCGQCQLNVYNLSEMSKTDAEELIVKTEGRLCVRYYQRRDGSIITQNCPVGLRAIKRRVSRVATALTSALLSFLSGIWFSKLADSRYLVSRSMMGDIAFTGEMAHKPEKALIVTPVQNPLPQVEIVTGRLMPIPKEKYVIARRHNR